MDLLSMHPADYAEAEPARQRLAKKHPFRLFASLPNLKRANSSTPERKKRKRQAKAAPVQDSPQSIVVHDELAHSHMSPIILYPGTENEDRDDQDLYRWAVLYENQRGVTVFSIPYYSSRSLLPTDPPAFTIPSSHAGTANQPKVSITSFPLPDGTWSWVSRTWMIDMRTDSGEVQHDGFEYNWDFRSKKWKAEVGSFSAGGFVRRRRWVRLMMRPCKHKRAAPEPGRPDGSASAQVQPSWIENLMEGHSPSISSAVSIVTSASESLDESPDTSLDDIWQGRDTEQDWARCHALMKRLGRDGRKLEIWQKWLGEPATGKGKQREIRWTEDSTPVISEAPSVLYSPISKSPPPPIEHVASVIRAHGDSILRLFIFPDSRAQFIKLLDRAGLLAELRAKYGKGWSTSEVDFWSYMNGLDAVQEAAKEHEAEHHDQEHRLEGPS